MRGTDGVHRIDDRDDPICIEVATALQNDVPIIPILVNDATMPRESELPNSINRLASINALVVRPNPDFRNDMKRLSAVVRQRRHTYLRRSRGRMQVFLRRNTTQIKLSVAIATAIVVFPALIVLSTQAIRGNYNGLKPSHSTPTSVLVSVVTPTSTCPYLNSGNGVTFYSGRNYTGYSWNWYVMAGNNNAVANLPSEIAGNLGSFSDSNSAWHVVLYLNQNGTGNLGHFDESNPDVGSLWRTTQSVSIYIRLDRNC
jgi:hypothetical protein